MTRRVQTDRKTVNSTDDPGQYFIVKNSWGTWWGESSYFRIAYSEINSVVNFGDHTIAYTGSALVCSYSTSLWFPAGGGVGTIQVTAPSECPWGATSQASWITVTSGSGQTGSGQMSFSVASNPTSVSRTGTLTVAGQVYAIAQEGSQTCTFSISPTSQSFAASGGTGSVSVTATSGCSWTAVSNARWITITSGPSGSGNCTVYYSVASNTETSPRVGTLTIAGKTFNVTQAGTSSAPDISVSPMSYNFGYVTKYKSKSTNITVANTGSGPLTVTSIRFEGANSSHYKQTNNCGTVEPGASCTVTVTFIPTVTNITLSAYLVISSNDPDENPVKVFLQGKGTNY